LTFIVLALVNSYNFYFLWPEKKRKRENEDLYGHQQVNLGDDATRVNSGDAALSTPVHSFLYLWDFELIPEAHNENLS